MSFLLDALGKADDDRRKAEVPELRTYRRRETTVWGRIGRASVLIVLLLVAFGSGYLARPWLETSWLAEKEVNTVAGPVQTTVAAPDVTTAKPVGGPQTTAVTSVLELEVISWSERPQARFAMINGSVVHEGDTLDSGERLLRIEQDAVVLKQSDQTIRLTM